MRDHPYAWACGDEAGETGFRFERGSTTHFLCCLLLADDLQPLRDYVSRTTLVLDRFNGDQTTIRLIHQWLRATGRSRLMKKIKMVRSESDQAIQVADMVAGAILRGVTTGDHSFYLPIRDRLILWEYSADKNPPS
jgi:hypothetical protein